MKVLDLNGLKKYNEKLLNKIDNIINEKLKNYQKHLDGIIDNFNTTLTEGEYSFGSNNVLTGSPENYGLYGKLIVKVNDGGTHDNQSNWIWQFAYCTNGNNYWRNKVNNTNWSSWRNFNDNNNAGIHSKIDLKSGTFYDCILNKINEGFVGGKIEINNYCPSDTCNGNYWGFVEWTCNLNKFAHLIFYSDRWEVLYVREISFGEGTDTGWQRIGDGCNAGAVNNFMVNSIEGNYLRPINYGTNSLTPGVSDLNTGYIYFQYE